MIDTKIGGHISNGVRSGGEMRVHLTDLTSIQSLESVYVSLDDF